MNEPEFVDAEDYTSTQQANISFREIVLQHLRRITILSSKELRGGYWDEKRHPNPSMNETIFAYIPDSREEYNNAISILHDLLLPHFDKQMQKVSDDISKKLDELYKNTLEKTELEESELLGDEYYGESDRAVLSAYKVRKLRLNRKLFQELSLLLSRLKYLEGKIKHE